MPNKQQPISSSANQTLCASTLAVVHAVGDLPLFSSDTKFDSGTGWPSFFAPIDPSHVIGVLSIGGMLVSAALCLSPGLLDMPAFLQPVTGYLGAGVVQLGGINWLLPHLACTVLRCACGLNMLWFLAVTEMQRLKLHSKLRLRHLRMHLSVCCIATCMQR